MLSQEFWTGRKSSRTSITEWILLFNSRKLVYHNMYIHTYNGEIIDCSQPSISSYFYLMVECADRIKLDISAKQKTWLGRVGNDKNRGAVDIFGKRINSLFFSEKENSHWLKGVITLTMASHDCIQVCFAACSNYHHWHMLRGKFDTCISTP